MAVSLVMDINIPQHVLASMSGTKILLRICDFHIGKKHINPDCLVVTI